jgi:hypothetical protein
VRKSLVRRVRQTLCEDAPLINVYLSHALEARESALGPYFSRRVPSMASHCRDGAEIGSLCNLVIVEIKILYNVNARYHSRIATPSGGAGLVKASGTSSSFDGRGRPEVARQFVM